MRFLNGLLKRLEGKADELDEARRTREGEAGGATAELAARLERYAPRPGDPPAVISPAERTALLARLEPGTARGASRAALHQKLRAALTNVFRGMDDRESESHSPIDPS